MWSKPSLEEQQLIAETRRLARVGFSAREVQAEVLVSLLFGIGAAVIWMIRPPGHVPLLSSVLCLAVLVLAMRVRFETSFGYTVATQLAFVPLLFALPAALVPLAVLVAVGLSRLPAMVTGQVEKVRLLQAPSNSVFAIGPAAVFAIAGAVDRSSALVLIAALLAQFATDFAAATLFNRIVRGARARDQVKEAWWVWAIDASLSGVGLIVAHQIRGTPLVVLTMVPLLWLLREFARERTGRLAHLLELNDTYKGTALLLGDVIGATDEYTGEHSRGVVELCLALGDELGFDAEQRRNLEFGALLHDVGKIAIPDEILNKPGKLDAREWTVMKTHSAEGERMLRRVGGFMNEVALIVRSHHERWDGGGYPDGLSGDQSPLASRIITCCDSWSAMRTDRPYRQALDFGVALAELERNVGTQFDPMIAETLLRVVSAGRGQAASSAASSSSPSDELSSVSSSTLSAVSSSSPSPSVV